MKKEKKQWTGKKDINGAKIYFGDFVRCYTQKGADVYYSPQKVTEDFKNEIWDETNCEITTNPNDKYSQNEDRGKSEYSAKFKCKKCDNKIDAKGLHTDGLCNSCYYKEEEFTEETGKGFAIVGAYIIKYIIVGLLAVAGLFFWLIG